MDLLQTGDNSAHRYQEQKAVLPRESTALEAGRCRVSRVVKNAGRPALGKLRHLTTAVAPRQNPATQTEGHLVVFVMAPCYGVGIADLDRELRAIFRCYRFNG